LNLPGLQLLHPSAPAASPRFFCGFSTSLFSVLPFLQSPQLALAGFGLALAATTMVSGAAAASELPAWTLKVGSTQSPVRQVAFLPPPAAPRVFAITPERRALLNTIRYAEGTWKNGEEIGYRILFGGSLFHSFDRHPDRVMYSPRYASAAAGAYQFMPFTWDMVTRSMGLVGFHPENQDQGALFLIQRRGALPLADRGELTPELAARLSPEWASFPTLAGRSYYGQPVKRFDDLRSFYEQNLAQLRNERPAGWERVAIREVPPACTSGRLACQLDAVRSTPPEPRAVEPMAID
jgi:muramidase (phage lysozyme)